jgi:hypothetical protein
MLSFESRSEGDGFLSYRCALYSRAGPEEMGLWSCRSALSENSVGRARLLAVPVSESKKTGALAPEVFPQALEHLGQSAIPLVPIMPAGAGMKLILEPTPLQQRRKSLICGKQSLLLSAAEIQIRHRRRICGSRKNVRIVRAPCVASPPPKDLSVPPVLPHTMPGERSCWNIQCRTKPSRERVQVGMLEAQYDSSESAHRNPNDCAIRAATQNREAMLNIADQVLGDVVLISIFRASHGIHVIGRVAFRHHKNESLLRKSRHIRVIRPISISAPAAVQEIHNRKFLIGRDTGRQNYAVR